ncbi:dol-P-Man:Man(5)GlcNAc(2)-PP-Dol alpha-1,3-mannosyltransferase [Oryza brachyantha]|uniref:dolichyl-P-Man:Man5GlcNAc2-PP-dolichol alpha-1,3-mannosyltransferase n=1 Tax=Oryza brachyantha TaxID=4533 RepID=J3KWU0_ORYBR|nr:dol-P-Man:Man(5)GlcNAc(2)-PP-Dol alpha-1,3-mannosyltransferase [Oryza brachyantha]
MARVGKHSAGESSSPSPSPSPPPPDRRPLYFAAFLLLADAALVALIVAFVPYTKIDWDAYMAQVDAFAEGERDYTKIEGDTGPLVYPAGFLYVYSAIKFLTAGQVFPAQILFGVLYIVNLSLVLLLYVKTEVLPWWALGLLCFSKRVHSIFVLRLFNDCFAMTFLHASMVLIIYHKWYLGLIIFSAAVSIKMNVLLFAPSLLLLMLKAMSIKGVFFALSGAAALQVLLGIPFLLSHPVEYISRAFNLGRVFIHFWSVNFKFVPEKFFVSKELAVALLVLHLTTLIVFAHYKWLKHEGGVFRFLHSRFKDATSIQQFIFSKPKLSSLSTEHIVTVMFVGNFIGIVCARSLHYQFYSWYFYSLPFLLWKTPFPTFVRIILFVGVEICWNIFPSTAYSSLLLLFLHISILVGLWSSPAEYPYANGKK